MPPKKATYTGRHQAPTPTKPPHPKQRTVPNRRPGPAHSAGNPTPTKKATKKAAPSAPAPTLAAPATGPTARERRDRVFAQEARSYADRQAFRATHAKPSVTGRAASGAAAGAATGAALGSVVPGIGNAVGAGAGAVLGGVGGGISGSRAKKAYRLAQRTNGNARRILVVEFAICIVVAAMSPLTDEKRDEKPGAWMKRMTAIMGLFFLLGLISSAGRGAAKAAAGFGGIVAVVLAISERNLFTKLAGVFSSTDDKPAEGTGPSGEQAIGGAPEPSDLPAPVPVAPRRVGASPLPPRGL